MNFKSFFIFLLLFKQKEIFSLNKSSVFNKKPFSSYINDSAMVLLPSMAITGLGLISTFLIEQIIKTTMPKKYKNINKNIIRSMYFISALPGLIYFLRSSFPNLINVFTRTKGFSPYKEDVLKIPNVEYNSIDLLGVGNYKKTLFIFTHGSFVMSWGTSDMLKKNIKTETHPYFFEIYPTKIKNFFTLKWRGDLSIENMQLTGERLSKEIQTKIKEEKYEKVVFIGHSNGGRVMIEAAYDFYKNNNTPIDIFTFSTPMNDNIALKLNAILKNENNKWIGSFIASDFIAQYDPFGGDTSWLKLGTGVNDQRYIKNFGLSKNSTEFMAWFKDQNNNIDETEDHNSYMKYFFNNFYYFYKEINEKWKNYSEKKNTIVFEK
jgi:hypothetical protein